jgi:hypothetical protein
MARRQRLTRHQGLAIAEREAWRRFGRDHHMLFITGPYVWRMTILAAVVGVLVLAWMKIPHVYLGVGALVAAAGVAVGWIAWTASHNSLQARMMARASGGPVRRGVGLGWAVGLVVVLLGSTGWLALWSPYA